MPKVLKWGGFTSIQQEILIFFWFRFISKQKISPPENLNAKKFTEENPTAKKCH
jgi:hypothetical protein